MGKSKNDFNSKPDLINGYVKAPRRLTPQMIESLKTGKLKPLLDRVIESPNLKLEIRDSRFNIYYCGGSLLKVTREDNEWIASFDKKYDLKNSLAVDKLLPPVGDGPNDQRDANAWVDNFDKLTGAMDSFRNRNNRPDEDPKDPERQHSMSIAVENSARRGKYDPNREFVILDVEYNWARRSFDLVAARRKPDKSDPTGWIHPELIFIEVKSRSNACYGNSGIVDHAIDYACMITAEYPAGSPDRGKEFRTEFEKIVEQKRELGLIDTKFPFKNFSEDTPPKLIFVLVEEAAREFEAGKLKKGLWYKNQSKEKEYRDRILKASSLVHQGDSGFQVIRIPNSTGGFVLGAPDEWLKVEQ